MVWKFMAISMKDVVPLEVQKAKALVSFLMKNGYSENDANAAVDAYIRYGTAQSILDGVVTKENQIQIRLLEPKDFDSSNRVIIISSINGTNLNPPILLKNNEDLRINGLVFSSYK